MNNIEKFLLSEIDERDKILLERAVKTLLGNVIEKPKDDSEFIFEDYKGIVPSPRTYKGVWNWDGAFHMLTMAYMDKEISHDQARIMFKFQLENGQLPDVVYTNGKSVTKFTKPPVFAWAIMCTDKVVPDREFLEYSYPYLQKNLKWWETERFDGIMFSYKVHKMESGWDNTPRFDFPHKIDNCYAVDCNCFMVDFYKAMEYIAQRIDKSQDIAVYKKKRQQLTKRINEILYSEEKNYYCDYNFKTKKLTHRLSPASFMPLFSGIADNEQAQGMSELAENPDYFYKGIPTISYNNRKYRSHKYWRGPCWLNQAYFTVRGLYDYGYKKTAMDLADNILGWCAKNKDSIYEYYDSRTGLGIGAQEFGWSSVFIIELILLKYNKNIW